MADSVGFIPSIWAKEINPNFDANDVMLQCVNTKFEGEIKNAGDTVHIPTIGDISVNTYGEADISYQEPQIIDQTLVVDQQKYFAFGIEDVEKVQSNVELVQSYSSRAKEAINTVKDQYLLGKHLEIPASNIIDGASGCVLEKNTIYSKFVEISRILANNNAKDTTGKMPWVVINPDVEAILRQAPEFVHATELGDKVIRNGSIGSIAGLDVLVTTNLKPAEGKLYVMAGITDAITFASQITKIETIRAQGRFKDLVRGLYVYGAKTINQNQLAKLVIKTGA